MLAQNATRIKLLKIWEILCQETDEDHPMESTVLIRKLDEMGIHCERKTIYRDIDTLIACGYDIVCERGKKNQYYVLDRSFDLPELHIMLDAVQAASFITPKKTALLVDKLANLAGSRKGEVIKRNIVAFNTTKNGNENIYYSVDEIVRAITKKKKIEFQYFDYNERHKKVYRKEGAKYIMNPYSTVFSDDNYYFLCYNDKYRTIMHYRVDRMDNVKMIDEDILPLEENKKFDVTKHKKEVFGMFMGQEEKVTFDVHKSLLDVIYDKFGVDIHLITVDDNTYRFTADVQISPVFMGWCCAFGEKVKIVAPDSVLEQLRKHVQQMVRQYEIINQEDKK